MYGTAQNLRDLLPQVPQTIDNDDRLTETLTRATAIVDGVLGYSYAAYGAAADKDVRSEGGVYLELPAYQAGSITAISQLAAKGTTSESTSAITDYDALDDGRLYRYNGWGVYWYRIHAIWGYGPVPDDVLEVTLELAVNLWRGRDAGGYSDVTGVSGGGAVGYERALTNRQRMVLDNARREAAGLGIA